jgi:hypothetical protein
METATYVQEGGTMTSITDKLSELDEYLENAKGIAWDTCHKIYIMMDDQEVEQMRDYDYDPLITSEEMTPAEMLSTVLQWYNDSCELRLIDVTSTGKDGTEFYTLMAQFEDEDEEEEE